jgi:hypothetical protein
MTDTEERIRRGLLAARFEYAAALVGRGADGRNGMRFLQSYLRVDQRRAIVATAADDRDWAAGSIDTSHELGRLFLALFVGPERYLQVGDVVRFLAQNSEPSLYLGANETHAALFLNLMVVEPYYRPAHEQAVWLAAALQIAKNRPDTDIHSLLPGLLTDRDPIEGHETWANDDSWTAMEAALLADAIPESAHAVASAASGVEMQAVVHNYRPHTSTFIRDHLVGAVRRYIDRSSPGRIEH